MKHSLKVKTAGRLHVAAVIVSTCYMCTDISRDAFSGSTYVWPYVDICTVLVSFALYTSNACDSLTHTLTEVIPRAIRWHSMGGCISENWPWWSSLLTSWPSSVFSGFRISMNIQLLSSFFSCSNTEKLYFDNPPTDRQFRTFKFFSWDSTS